MDLNQTINLFDTIFYLICQFVSVFIQDTDFNNIPILRYDHCYIIWTLVSVYSAIHTLMAWRFTKTAMWKTMEALLEQIWIQKTNRWDRYRRRANARNVSFRRRANARNVSFRISLRWPIHIINPVDKTQLSLKRKTTVLMRSQTLKNVESNAIIGKTNKRFQIQSFCFRGASEIWSRLAWIEIVSQPIIHTVERYNKYLTNLFFLGPYCKLRILVFSLRFMALAPRAWPINRQKKKLGP